MICVLCADMTVNFWYIRTNGSGRGYGHYCTENKIVADYAATVVVSAIDSSGQVATFPMSKDGMTTEFKVANFGSLSKVCFAYYNSTDVYDELGDLKVKFIDQTIIVDNPEYPVFLGLIKIETADEVLYQYENCAVYRHENWNLLFSTDPIRKRDWDVPERILLENYGILMVSDDWSEVFLLYMKDELGPYTGPKGEVFAGPASSKAEAVAIAERLSANNIYKDDSWD